VEEGQQSRRERKEVNGYLLDTHFWIWLQQANTREISADARARMLRWQRDRTLHLSLTSVWEVARLAADGQLDLGITSDQFGEDACSDDGLIPVPISTRILIESTRLPGTLHRDPADRLLAATAREHHLTLITRDDQLLRYSKQGHLSARKP
jgi:PIN domain nuclease of toxin-antitoxin system